MANISTWSTTAANNNAATPDGWPEGQAPSTVNNCGREMMAAVRTWFEDAQWLNLGNTPTRIDNDTITIAGDVTATYTVGRRLKFVGATTGYATISASSYGAPNTTIDVVNDSGNIPTSLVSVAVGILTPTSSALPVGSASFTGTFTGFSSGTVTVTVNYRVVGGIAFVAVPSLTNVNSNSISLTMTGIPAAIAPLYGFRTIVLVRDSAVDAFGSVAIGVGGTTLLFTKGATTGAGGFTASGEKGLSSPLILSWIVS